MALKLFKGKTEPQCAHCEYAEIADGSEVVVCRKIGGIMQLHSKCKKYKYDPLKREPKKLIFTTEFTKDDFDI
jgi:ribosomal protein L24E